MDDGPTTLVDFRYHKFFRLIYEPIIHHPHRDNLTALHGSVIVRGGSVLSWALNHPGRCGFSNFYAYHENFTTHSELHAIKKVRKKIDLTGSSIFNLRINKHGEIRMSKPCPSCEIVLARYGFKKAFYSTDCGNICSMKFNPIRERLAA